MKTINKTLLVTLGVALTLTLSACTGCSPHQWSSSESEISSVEPEPSSEPVQTYKIRWLNYDGSLLYTSRDVREGELPVYGGKTPTRESDAQYSYVWDGWTPEVVPATKNTSYKATYTSETRTYTIYFDQKNEYVGYTQDKIENVPYGSSIDINFDTITINGVSVSPINNYPEEEKKYFNIDFESWNVAPNTIVTGDMEIQAFYTHSTRMYDLSVVPVGDCKIQYAGDDDVYHDTDGGYFAEKVKSYVGEVTVSSDPITHLSLQSPIGSQYFRVYFAAVPLEDPFFEYEFDGWYCDGELLTGSKYIFGDVEIEARFTSSRKDFSHIFEYELDTLRREAIITGVKEEYQHTNFPVISIPETADNGWPVSTIKNGALCKVEGLRCVYIPDTFIYFEETDGYGIFPAGIEKIVVNETNTHFKVVDGILYTYDMREIISGSLEMWSYFDNHTLVLSDDVTRIWSFAFRYLQIENVTLPSGLTEISQSCFYANNITSVVIPETVEKLDFYALGGNEYETINIPDSVKVIEGGAIGGSKLRIVNIGSGLKEISDWVFDYTYTVEEVNISPDNPYFSSYNGVLYSKDFSSLVTFPTGLENAPAFAAGLKKIKYNAFRSCAITNITLPEGLEEIESSAFYDCKYLTTVYLPGSLNKFGAGIFSIAAVNELHYAGTMAQFEAIEKPTYGLWYSSCWNLHAVICTDGDIPITPTNGY